MPVGDTGNFDGNGKDPGRVVETLPLSHPSDRGLNGRGTGQEKRVGRSSQEPVRPHLAPEHHLNT